MSLQLVELADAAEVKTPELRERAIRSPRAQYTGQYLALDGSTEKAFVALDLEPERVVVYEIWVPRPLRRQGVARSVLEQIERLVTDRGYSEVFLRPEPLEPDVDKALLTTFYMRNGYRMIADGVMIKQVAS